MVNPSAGDWGKVVQGTAALPLGPIHADQPMVGWNRSDEPIMFGISMVMYGSCEPISTKM